MSIVLADSYSEGNRNSSNTVFKDVMAGQSFTGANTKISLAKFLLIKQPGKTGNVVAKLYSHTGTYGSTGTPDSLLATSEAVDAGLISATFSLIDFSFVGNQRYQMSSGTKYFILVQPQSEMNLAIGTDNTSPTHDGNFWISTLGANSSTDACFYVYGGYETPIVGNKYPLPAFKI